jgi:hypothetical protein
MWQSYHLYLTLMTLKTLEMTGTKSKFRSKFRFRLDSVPVTGRNFSGILNLAAVNDVHPVTTTLQPLPSSLSSFSWALKSPASFHPPFRPSLIAFYQRSSHHFEARPSPLAQEVRHVEFTSSRDCTGHCHQPDDSSYRHPSVPNHIWSS